MKEIKEWIIHAICNNSCIKTKKPNLSDTNHLQTTVWFQVFLSDTNNLHTIVWFQVFLSNTNNLHTLVWFQVFLSNTNNVHTVVKAINKIRKRIFVQLIKFQWIIWTFHTLKKAKECISWKNKKIKYQFHSAS